MTYIDIHVATTGSDSNDGSENAPLHSLTAAQLIARNFAGRQPVRIIFADGIHYLPQTIRFTAADSGSPAAPVLYTAAHEGHAILSGGQRLHLQWQLDPDGIARASVPPGLTIDQLYINGRRQRMARFPNPIPNRNLFDTWTLEHRNAPDPANDALASERLARWSNPAGGYLHAMHPALWGDMHWRITAKNPDGSLAMEGGWQNNRPAPMHGRYRFVENIREELDSPGEWFHDAAANILLYIPETGVDLHTATVEVVRLTHLVEFIGEPSRPVTHIHLSGFTFRHAARSFMLNREPLNRSDWTTYRGGAVLFAGAVNCTLSNCTFDQLGGNTIFADGYNRELTIRGCLISDSGANGIAFVGRASSVRSPLFRYEQPFRYEDLDRTPGPLSEDYPANCLVEDCLIRRTGRDEKQTAPIQISMAMDITVRHCSIYDVPRAGININEGTFGGHLIEFCDVFNTVLETGDHGSFNSWGRDRYWHPSIQEVDRQVAADPSLPLLDVVKPITLRNSRWRCDHGWDIDLDDGSSNYRIYNNLLLNGGLKLREGYQRIATNNIILNNSLHPHCWYSNSGDVFQHNIVFDHYQPAGGMPADQWGARIDHNLFACSEAHRTRFAAQNCDAHSITADPQFIDPSSGDFRVRDSSPALELGFRNFPMTHFGVRKPSLRAIAKSPEIPAVHPQIDLTPAPASAAANAHWRHLELRNIQGREFSAYGVSPDSGGVAVVKTHPGNNDGFHPNDLIQCIDNQSCRSLAELTLLTKRLEGRTHVTVGIIRQQKLHVLTLLTALDTPKL